MFKWLKKIKKLVAPKTPSTKKIALAPVEDSSLKPNEKTCPVCGKVFLPTMTLQKYCSKECRYENHKLTERLNYARRPKRRPHKEKTCPKCGKTFTAKIPRQRFCSEECRLESRQAHHEEKACVVCGKTFTAKTSKQRFCSKECCNSVYNPPGQIVKCKTCGKEFQRGVGGSNSCPECREKLKAGRQPDEKTCPVCQEKFLPRRSNQIYCSFRCCRKINRVRARIRKRLLTPKPAPVAKVKPQEIKPRACLFCGKIFTPERDSTKMCSPECGRKYQESKFFEKTCEFCGKPFRSKRATKKFCSAICYGRAKDGHKLEDFAPRACNICGKIFAPRWAGQRFCSSECSSKRYHAKKREKRCLLCGKEFTSSIGHQKYCSHDCKEKARRAKGAKLVTCLICGEKFLQGQGYRKCCSIKCQDVMDELRTKSWALNKKRRGQDISSSPTEERECILCGKTFSAPIDSDKKFCSTLCELVDDYRENHPPEEKVEKKKPEKKKTLTDWQKEAQQCGMSYGIYRAQIERFGKTFEELVIR